MDKTFYMVEQSINGRQGCLPTRIQGEMEAVEFATRLVRMAHEVGVKSEVHLYEVKEIEF